MRLPSLSLVPTGLLMCLAAACSTTTSPQTTTVGPAVSSRPTSTAPATATATVALRSQLLQLTDLPDLADRREFSSTDPTTQAAPQLALCSQVAAVAPHQLASVLAKPRVASQVEVFEIVSAFADAASARQAFDQAAADSARCRSYAVADVPYQVVDLSRPLVRGATAALQYRLTTPNVIAGDVRTVAVTGRFLVLITGYGTPPDRMTILTYQVAVMAKALARLSG